jgi:hypothetical protein
VETEKKGKREKEEMNKRTNEKRFQRQLKVEGGRKKEEG